MEVPEGYKRISIAHNAFEQGDIYETMDGPFSCWVYRKSVPEEVVEEIRCEELPDGQVGMYFGDATQPFVTFASYSETERLFGKTFVLKGHEQQPDLSELQELATHWKNSGSAVTALAGVELQIRLDKVKRQPGSEKPPVVSEPRLIEGMTFDEYASKYGTNAAKTEWALGGGTGNEETPPLPEVTHQISQQNEISDEVRRAAFEQYHAQYQDCEQSWLCRENFNAGWEAALKQTAQSQPVPMGLVEAIEEVLRDWDSPMLHEGKYWEGVGVTSQHHASQMRSILAKYKNSTLKGVDVEALRKLAETWETPEGGHTSRSCARQLKALLPKTEATENQDV